MRREERAFHVAPPSGPFRERCACGNAIARGIFHHKLQALPLNQAFGQDIARCWRGLRGNECQSLATQWQAHEFRLIRVRNEGSNGRLFVKHTMRQNFKLAKILTPHQRRLKRFWVNEIPKGTIHQKKCHLARRIFVGDAALRCHQREIIIEHRLQLSFLLRLTSRECQQIANGLNHSHHKMAWFVGTATYKAVGASSIRADVAFEEVSKSRREIAIFPSVSLERNKIEEWVDVFLQQILAECEDGHHQTQFVLQIVDIARLVEFIHHPLDGFFRLLVGQQFQGFRLQLSYFHSGGNGIAQTFAFRCTKSLEPLSVFNDVKSDASINV